ncbi:MAG: DNA helicase RecQ [Salinivirgaceae bacterium]|nr:DNA helicase RecQ [Salinivirgaceae bacterium]
MSQENLSPEGLLQKHFGYSTFRPQQKEIIQHIIDGKDAVVLMPTGGGKSMCYQLPALMRKGLTVVISPLIALMKDQVQALQSNGIKAAYLNSSMLANEENLVREELQQGNIKLLYVSPERLFSRNFLDYIGQLNVGLFAIDEAHCVSSWGHHFRPEYKKLSILKQVFQSVPVVALTATADRAVRGDISLLLNLNKAKYFISSFDRPNLSLAVLPGQNKWKQIERILQKYHNKCGIIYCSSRAGTEKLAQQIQSLGFSAKAYHAGMKSDERSKTQDEFIQGSLKIVCATLAFGMGIDKSNVRFVIHHNMPGNLESYYQEIGRAGRDGQPAEAILFYSYRDVQTHLGFISKVTDQDYAKIQKAKLNRMQEYAEAQVCRRKILLSYFSELPEHDCENCDVCANPPKYFDGTKEAQMALSAVYRTGETIGVSTLIDVLKGTHSTSVLERKLDTIKTFGAGKQITLFSWQMFVQQLIQQGYLEIDYKDHYNLRLNLLSRQILFESRSVRLVSPETIKDRQEKLKEKPKDIMTNVKVDDSLFDYLKSLRKEIADKIKKPAFVVFSNASLLDMCERLPVSYDEFLEVTGVGEHKAELYAGIFTEAIKEFTSGKTKGDTYKETMALYTSGKTIPEIALVREMQEITVYSHLAHLISNGYELNIRELVSDEALDCMNKAIKELGFMTALKPYQEFFTPNFNLGKIRIMLSYFKLQEEA